MRILMVTLLCLSGSIAHADPLLGLDIGVSPARFVGQSRGTGWSGKAPQGLKKGLIDSRLLEQINRAGVTPKTREGGLDPAQFGRFERLTRGRTEYLAAFSSDEKLSFLLVKIAAPLKFGSMFSKDRLRAREQVLQSLSPYRLKVDTKDRYGNVSVWRGRTARGGLWVRYVPEEEMMWLLLHSRSGASR